MNHSKWLRQFPIYFLMRGLGVSTQPVFYFSRWHKRQHAASHKSSIRRGSRLPCRGRIILWTGVQPAVQRQDRFLDAGPACRAMMMTMMYTVAAVGICHYIGRPFRTSEIQNFKVVDIRVGRGEIYYYRVLFATFVFLQLLNVV